MNIIGYQTHTQTIYISIVEDKDGFKYGASTLKDKAVKYALEGKQQAVVGKPDWLTPIAEVCPELVNNQTKLLLGANGIQKQYLPDNIRNQYTIAPVVNGNSICLILMDESKVIYIHGDDLVQCCLQAVIEHHKSLTTTYEYNLLDVKRKIWLAKWLTRIDRIYLHEII